MDKVEFFYGLGSRYSYLAFSQIERLEAKHNCRFELHPASTPELMALNGVSPFDGSYPSGQYRWDYRQSDAEAWAAYYGIPYVEPKSLPDDPNWLPEGKDHRQNDVGVKRFAVGYLAYAGSGKNSRTN